MTPPPWTITYTGRRVDPKSLRPSDLSIRDIAHSLSQLCRFGGHCPPFYSVAEHSIHTSRLLPSELALAGLLHDAAEAYLGDMVRPVKAWGCSEEYRQAEAHILNAIGQIFSITQFDHPLVRRTDEVMLATEADLLFPSEDTSEWGLNALPTPKIMHLPHWDGFQAETRFMARFLHLRKLRNLRKEQE